MTFGERTKEEVELPKISLAGAAAFLEALGALPPACIEALEEQGINVVVAPGGRAPANTTRLGSNVISLI